MNLIIDSNRTLRKRGISIVNIKCTETGDNQSNAIVEYVCDQITPYGFIQIDRFNAFFRTKSSFSVDVRLSIFLTLATYRMAQGVDLPTISEFEIVSNLIAANELEAIVNNTVDYYFKDKRELILEDIIVLVMVLTAIQTATKIGFDIDSEYAHSVIRAIDVNYIHEDIYDFYFSLEKFHNDFENLGFIYTIGKLKCQ